MAATYRGRQTRSTGGGAVLLLVIVVCAAACATPPTRPHPEAPRTVYAFVERDSAPPAVLRQAPDGGWRIQRGVLVEDQRDTPRRTLLAFVRALQSSDYPALRELAPASLRKGMTLQSLRDHVETDPAATTELLDRLKSHLDAPIKLDGETAQMRYAGAVFEMRFEDGGWVVIDPD